MCMYNVSQFCRQVRVWLKRGRGAVMRRAPSRTAKPEDIVARREARGNHNAVDERCGSQVTRAVTLHVDTPAGCAVGAVPRHPMRGPNLLLARWIELPALEPNCGAVAGLEILRLPRRSRVEIDARDRVHLPHTPGGRGALRHKCSVDGQLSAVIPPQQWVAREGQGCFLEAVLREGGVRWAQAILVPTTMTVRSKANTHWSAQTWHSGADMVGLCQMEALT
jgi:hypothetical protein